MKEKTQELLKKFEVDNEVYVNAEEALTYWIVYARIPEKKAEGTHRLHRGIKYVSGPNEDGNVLIMRDAFRSDAYSAESWGPMKTIDDFAKKALVQILAEKDAEDTGQEEGCGSSCS